jgi:hypothetical protein
MNKRSLAFSLLVNAALLAIVTVFVLRDFSAPAKSGQLTVDSAVAAQTQPTAVNATTNEHGARDSASIRELHAQLSGANVPDELVKRTIVSAIIDRADTDSNREFWRPKLYRDAERRMAQFEAFDSARRTLVEVFGKDAAQDPAFTAVFRPRHIRWHFLSPTSQIAAERVLSSSLRSRLKEGVEAPTPAERDALDQDLRTAMSADEFHEFQLRESALAEQLTSIEFEFSELEYRKVFDVWSNAMASAPLERRQSLSPLRAGPSDDGVMRQVESILGTERFSLYARGQDPVYKLLKSTSAMYSLGERSAERAYVVIQDAKAKAMPLIAKSPVVSVDTREKLLNLRSERAKKLREILGESVAQLIERSIAPFDAFDLGIGRVPVVMVR